MENKANKTAIITGISGMDGSYLAEFLLEKGYKVHGIIRRSSSINTKRLDNIYFNQYLFLHYGDLSDSSFVNRIILEINPDEIYNLGAMSHVGVSFQIPEYTTDIDALGTLRLLEGIRNTNKNIKFYQASTSELYGGVYDKPQNEDTPFNPRSPYAIAKQYSFWITKNYRESYNMFAVNGILFNHTSPRRGETFVEQKIVKGAVAILKNKQKNLKLGNIYSYRDYGHSKDYIKAMWLMLQHDIPEDFVIATGNKYMIKDIVTLVFSKLNIPIEWSGEDINEIGTIANNTKYPNKKGQQVVFIDPKYFRPSEVDVLVGDASKAKEKLNWEPEYTFDKIIDEMILEELENYNN
jgi:GDPmannose 4,6-dehydratase